MTDVDMRAYERLQRLEQLVNGVYRDQTDVIRELQRERDEARKQLGELHQAQAEIQHLRNIIAKELGEDLLRDI